MEDREAGLWWVRSQSGIDSDGHYSPREYNQYLSDDERRGGFGRNYDDYDSDW